MAVIFGTQGRDTRDGTDRDDVIRGWAEDGDPSTDLGDFLSGLGGDDTIDGGGGDDTLAGNAGNDLNDGGAGNDALAGGAGADRLAGDLGANDRCDGGRNDARRLAGSPSVPDPCR